MKAFVRAVDQLRIRQRTAMRRIGASLETHPRVVRDHWCPDIEPDARPKALSSTVTILESSTESMRERLD